MKNDKISLSQFWFVSFLCSVVSVLFLNNGNNIADCAVIAFSQLFLFAVTAFYKGNAPLVLRAISTLYLFGFCVLSAVRFTDYMREAIGYRQFIIIAIVLLIFCFFCSVKGLEAFFRASVIIAFFVIVSIVYIFVCGASEVDYNLRFSFEINPLPPLFTLFPSALYVLNYDNIKNERTSAVIAILVLSILTLLGFILISGKGTGKYPFQYIPEHSQISVFKGADCLLLGILTVSVLYIISSSVITVFLKSKHKYLTNSVFCVVIAGVSVLWLAISPNGNVILYEISAYILTAMYIFILIISVIKERFTT